MDYNRFPIPNDPDRGIHIHTPQITFVGRSGTGKTTYLERLIPLLREAGLRLGVVKHDVHGFQMDTPGKDTYRFAQAGAEVVAISSPWRVAVLEQPRQELSLNQVIARLPRVDLILTEGYKKVPNPKIEIHRAELNRPLLTPTEELLAVITDEALPLPKEIPQLSFQGLEDCRDLILGFVSHCQDTSQE